MAAGNPGVNGMTLQERSLSVDVLRGLTLALMIVVNTSVSDEASYSQLLHARWHGLTLTDLVFPTFLFAVGASLSYALAKYQQRGDAAVLKKVFRRAGLIFLCGYLLYWFPFFAVDQAGHLALRPISHTRIFGVLQHIALAYASAALIVHYGGRWAAGHGFLRCWEKIHSLSICSAK